MIPEKWFVQPKNKEEQLVIARWFDKNNAGTSADFYEHSAEKGYRSLIAYAFGLGAGISFYDARYTQLDLPEITYEQFVKEVLKQESMEKKIIGYKSTNILTYGNEVLPAGTLFVKDEDGDYENNTGDSPFQISLPKEVVEQWEAVYEEKEEIKEGDWLITIKEFSPYVYHSEVGFIFRNLGFYAGNYLFKGNPNGCISKDRVRKATREEIEQHLIAEAKEKGFISTVKFTGVRDVTYREYMGDTRGDNCSGSYSKQYPKVGTDAYSYNEETDTLYTWGFGVGIIYEKGVWGKLTPETVTLTLGTRKVPVIISSESVICRNKVVDMAIVRYIVNEPYEEIITSEWNIVMIDATFRVGCVEEDNRFTLAELQEVVDTQDKLRQK